MAEQQALPPVIFSLTDAGNSLAKRLLSILPDAIHKHQPTPFSATAQQTFFDGNPCVFICATGIVIRSLAPVLKNKFSDPAVIVMDEKGEYVIPLLSGHEGGAGVLARQISDAINAKCVVTSSTDYGNPIYTLGMGCDRGCPGHFIDELLELANDFLDNALKFKSIKYHAIASIDLKADESSLIALSEKTDIPFRTYNAAKLRSVEDQLTLKSDIVFSEVGCYGVAEAAALVAASEITGIGAEIVMPKHKNKRATISIARSYLQ